MLIVKGKQLAKEKAHGLKSEGNQEQVSIVLFQEGHMGHT